MWLRNFSDHIKERSPEVLEGSKDVLKVLSIVKNGGYVSVVFQALKIILGKGNKWFW